MTASLAALAALALAAPQEPPKKADPPVTTQVSPPTVKTVPPPRTVQIYKFETKTVTVVVRPPTVIRVGPMALPTPLIQHELWLAQSDAGDALPLYLAALRSLPRMNPEQVKQYEAASELMQNKPAGRATAAELAAARKTLAPAAGPLRLAARAARVRVCDWSPLVPPPGGSLITNITPLLDSVQGFRELAFYLKLRAYLARAGGDHPAALADAATTLGMARHIAAGDTAIQFLVGGAVSAIALQQVRQMAEDGGPNVLAALAEVPRPVLQSASAARRELDMFAGLYPPLDKLEGKLSAAEARRLADETHARLLAASSPDGAPALEPPLKGVAMMLDAFNRPDPAAAAKRLNGFGYPAERLTGMPADQVFLLDAAVRVRRATDAARLAAALPAGHPLLKPQPAADLTAVGEHPAQVGVVLLRLMLPALDKMRASQARADFNVATVTFTEALRAELAAPGAEWGPALLDAPLVKAARANVAVEWDAKTRAFQATDPGVASEVLRWVAKP